MLRRVALATVMALALLFSAATAGTASASPTVLDASALSSIQLAPASGYQVVTKFERHWWGYSMTFSKEATKIIASGGMTAGGVAIAVGLTGGAAIAVGGLGGALGEVASQAVDHGNCLQIVAAWSVPGWPALGAAAWPWRAHC